MIRTPPLLFDPQRQSPTAGFGLLDDGPFPGLAIPRPTATVQTRPVNVPHAAPPQPQRPSVVNRVGNALGQVFAGQNDPGLSPAQNEAARKQALLMAGLQMMAASGPSASPVGLGQIVAQGAMAGQQAGAGARGQILAGAQQQQLRELIGGGPPDLPKLKQLHALAVANGNVPMANSIAQVIQAQVSHEGRQTPDLQRFQGPDGRLYTFDPATGATAPIAGPDGQPLPASPKTFTMDGRTFPDTAEGRAEAIAWSRQVAGSSRAPSSEGGAVNWQTIQTPQGVMQLNPRTGAVRPVFGPDGQTIQKESTSKPSEGERMAGAALMMAQDAAPMLDQVERSVAASVVNRIPVIGNLVTPEYEQLANQAGMQLLGAYNLVVSGKGVTEQEFERNKETFMPMPGDKAGTLQRKRQARAQMLATIRKAAGHAGSAAAGAAAQNPFGDLMKER